MDWFDATRAKHHDADNAVSPAEELQPCEHESKLSGVQWPQPGQESALTPGAARATTPVLSSLLSVTAAIAAGIIIANNSSFKLKVPDGSHAANVHENATAPPGNAIAARPARPLAAPVAPALSVPRLEHPQVAIRQARKVRAPAEQKSVRQASDANAARRPPKANKVQIAGQTPRAPLARAATDRAGSAARIPSALPRPVRQSLPSLQPQYARCAQLHGLLRREQCKWNVCGGKWGTQGCPSYHYKTSPEIWLGQQYPAEDIRRQY